MMRRARIRAGVSTAMAVTALAAGLTVGTPAAQAECEGNVTFTQYDGSKPLKGKYLCGTEVARVKYNGYDWGFVVGTSRQLYMTYRAKNHHWHQWINMGGRAKDGVFVWIPSNTMRVRVIGDDRCYWERTRHLKQAWTPWKIVPDGGLGGPNSGNCPDFPV